jgi:FixJ family two-component response regulator
MEDSVPTVFLVDDDPDVLKGLGRLLASAGMKVVAFDSPGRFLESVDPAAAGCLVLDVAMPELDGLELQQALETRGCDLPIIFLTGHGDIPTSVRAMKRGAEDFLTKPVDEKVLFAAIRRAFDRNTEVRRSQEARRVVDKRLATLSAREREVLERVAAGRLNKQIAAELGLVEKTIKVHRAHVMQKMGARTFAQLLSLAEQAGIKVG